MGAKVGKVVSVSMMVMSIPIKNGSWKNPITMVKRLISLSMPIRDVACMRKPIKLAQAVSVREWAPNGMIKNGSLRWNRIMKKCCKKKCCNSLNAKKQKKNEKVIFLGPQKKKKKKKKKS